MFSFNNKKMISITLEGGDGIKNPKLFYKDPIFNASKVPTTENANWRLNGPIASGFNNPNSYNRNIIKTNLTNRDLFNRNNIEIQIVFSTVNDSAILVNAQNYAPQIGFQSSQCELRKISGNSNYFNFQIKNYLSQWLKLIITVSKTKGTDTFQVYKDDGLIYDKTLASTVWFGNDTNQIYLGDTSNLYSQALGGYSGTGYIDLAQTWFKDLNTNEILVPWFD